MAHSSLEEVVVSLEPWEYELAFQVGIRRFTANWNRPDAHYYNRARMEKDRDAQVAAAMCELAVAKHLNRYWHGSVWHASDHSKHRHKPDVGNNIEVRRVRTDTGPAVRRSDIGKVIWAARITDPEYREVELLGWIEGARGLEIGEQREGYKVVPSHLLSSPRPPFDTALTTKQTLVPAALTDGRNAESEQTQ